jgi:hypothetical protein
MGENRRTESQAEAGRVRLTFDCGAEDWGSSQQGQLLKAPMPG